MTYQQTLAVCLAFIAGQYETLLGQLASELSPGSFTLLRQERDAYLHRACWAMALTEEEATEALEDLYTAHPSVQELMEAPC